MGPLTEAFLPYGVLLFSLWGIAAIPEMRELFDAGSRKFGRAIVWGTAVPAILYGIFMLAFVGAFGEGAGAPIGDVVSMLGPKVLVSLAVFGSLAVATSYLVIGAYMYDTLRYDLRMRRSFAFSALFLPLFLFLWGPSSLVVVVALIGGILGAIDGTIIIRTWLRAKVQGELRPAFAISLPRGIAYSMLILFIGGALAELASVLRDMI